MPTATAAAPPPPAPPAVAAEAPAPVAFGGLTPIPDVTGMVSAPSRFPRLRATSDRIGQNVRDVRLSVADRLADTGLGTVVNRCRDVLAERRSVRIATVGGAGVIAVAVVLAVTLGSGPSTSSAADSAVGTDGHPTVAAPAVPHLSLTVPDTFTVPGHLALAWPSSGQAAIAVPGVGLLGSSGPVGTAQPIASVTKTMTAYLILKDHPLAPGQSGPVLTISAAEAAALPGEEALNQSLVPVRTGERFTERQALQALMLASADNMAEILAAWDAGSESRFVTRMNAMAATLGMTHTRFSQPSGYLGTSVSTATDLVKLGEAAITDPFFADLVDETSATIPGGTIRNYNALLGQDGVDGIKTGSTYWAGGCLLFSAHTRVAGHEITLVGAVLGQPGNISTMLPSVFAATARLLHSADQALEQVTVVGQARAVAELSGSGDATRLLHPSHAVTMVGWPGLQLTLRATGSAANPALETLTPDGRITDATPLVSG
ncbi:D-alanyl-D-alanine carboxypeptidase family protein [Streptacidiphilus fuscans]|uniref:D-alanyl-D-alanine carboxypeptidase n=1 Tax=Streptacidiphilus fuscans TaxID=2789292 RepID=A0A931FIL7_9ACTN|nr:D-alanyl-D-alanine carboxypeptidase [Streptacidiphilus fuscans]MBF9073056.1 D-alanyl-D-alanine carboxypeptidase [Streptacidiphilus fuscans]